MSRREQHPPRASSSAAAGRGGTVVTETTAGRIAGVRTGRVTVFRGVPYAAPPVGRLRFASPRPPEPWGGVRETTAFAPPSLQGDYLPGSAEDSLYANVWTPGVRGRRPVLVYVHGGGWLLGAGSEPDYDGARTAERGDLVVVTFNYRLGAFGWGLHEDLADPATGSFANWGLQDQAALLRWVRDNAEAFGGDPGNITLAGTSAGGSSAWQLSLLPELRGIVRRIVAVSTKHVWAPASSTTPEESRAVFERLARRFGTTVPGLRRVPAAALRDAWDGTFSGDPAGRAVEGWREYRGPVVDGRWMRGYDHALPTPAVPVMCVFARTEGSFFTTGPGYPFDGPLPADEAGLRAAVRAVLDKCAAKVGDEQVGECLAHYREALPAAGRAADPVSLWTEVWGDALFRYQIVRLAERHAREGRSPQYVMEFAHPVRPPYAGTPHEATSKFLFGTHRLPVHAPVYGDGPLERRISDTLIDLVASFARNGRPTSRHAPAWPVFDPTEPTAMILGGAPVARTGRLSALPQLRYWDTAGLVPRT
ncbi:carboxylesterase [Streptomyces carminius]|uniref:Carboxylic ester hydrolase n=1 Tax=Streptomyces carminius TaxID=2665496 RepID=A0A2M8LU38_9ACTN|nr:carboxylesterase family protein [Streptomyces carminius]PJE95478.1 carboxylesterase [Streptomyces carminius]